MRKYRILFMALSQTFLFGVMSAIQEVVQHDIDVDVFVPIETGLINPQFECDMIADSLKDMNLSIFRSIPENKNYDIVYSAYPPYYNDLLAQNRVKYHVRFSYGVAVANKPQLHSQNIYNFYDYVLCLSIPNVMLFSGFAQSVCIGNIKLANYKRSRAVTGEKKTLLYIPTWNGVNTSSSVNADTVKKLLDLRYKYNVVAKMHPQTSFYHAEREKFELFKSFDTVYNVTTPIADILNDVDVVLSDLSGAAFDAIAGDVPLALFGLGEPVYYGGKLCLHQQLVKDDIIPGTNDINELESIIEKALTPGYFAKQQKLKKEIFPFEGQECLDAFMRFQNDLFEDRVDPWYIATRRAIRENYIREQKETQERFEAMTLTHEDTVKEIISAYEKDLHLTRKTYENSLSWKLTKPFRAVAGLVNWKKH